MFDYSENLRWARYKVGLIASAALVIISLVVIFAANIGNLFAHKVDIYADFTDVEGLKKGAPAWLSGVQIGSVKNIRFRRPGAIRVEIEIESDDLRFIRRDSVATVNTMGILGDKYLEISPGADGALHPGAVIAGASPPGLQQIEGAGRGAIAKLAG